MLSCFISVVLSLFGWLTGWLVPSLSAAWIQLVVLIQYLGQLQWDPIQPCGAVGEHRGHGPVPVLSQLRGESPDLTARVGRRAVV